MIVRSAQQLEEGRDCWSTIAAYTGLTAPTDPPDFNEAPTGEPRFVELGADAGIIYLVQQTSGLTLQSTKLTMVDGIGRLRLPVRNSRGGDFAGVMTYNAENISTVLGLQEFTSANQRKAASTLINAIPRSAVDDCDAAAALRAAMTAFNTEEDKYSTGFASKTIVLFTDGRGVDGIDDALIQDLRRSNIGVQVSKLVPFESEAVDKLANQTVGKSAPALTRLPRRKALDKVLGRIEGQNAEMDEAQNEVGAGAAGQFPIDGVQAEVVDTTSQTHTFKIDGFTTAAIFDLTPIYETDPLTIPPLQLSLRDPDGQLIDLASPPPGVTVTIDEVDSKSIRVDGIRPGTWTCEVSTSFEVPVLYTLNVYGEGEELLTPNETVNVKGRFPGATGLKVKLCTEQSIVGANVVGTVFRPDGTSLNVTFFDDGDDAHGDELAGDGVYSTLFSQYAGPGDYLVAVQATNEGSAQFSTRFLFGESKGFTPGPTGPCPAFVRQTHLTLSCPVGTGTGAALLPLGNLQILSGGPGSVTLRWTNPNPGGTQTVIQRSIKFGEWRDLVTLPSGATEFTDREAGNLGDVFYRVLAKGPQGLSLPSDFRQLDMKSVSEAFQLLASGSGGGAFGTAGDDGGFCFVATAAYGSYLDPHVQKLRDYRDQALLASPGGPQAVQAYYRISPTLANFLIQHPWSKAPARAAISVALGAIEYPWSASALVLAGGLASLRQLRRRRRA